MAQAVDHLGSTTDATLISCADGWAGARLHIAGTLFVGIYRHVDEGWVWADRSDVCDDELQIPVEVRTLCHVD